MNYRTKHGFGQLHIKKRSLLEWLALFILVMPFFLSFFMDFLGVTSIIKYTIDVAWILCVGLLFLRRKVVFDRRLIPFLVFILVFLLYTLIVYIPNYQSIFYYLWGIRNTFRFYFAFIIFAMLFTEEEVEGCLKFLDVIFWINLLISLYQFFIMGLDQDFLGGLFGVERGCNAYSLIFFSIVLSRSIIRFMNKDESAFKCFSKCAVAILLAAMAELKFFFVMFVVILLMATIFTSFSWRKFFVILLSVVMVSVASTILTNLFGADGDISFENIINLITADNYATQEDLSRFSAIPKISSTIMTDTSQRMFGLGLGNCDTSTFEICNTPFYQTYSHLHYSWFSSAFLFLETGYVGLTLYMSFFVMCFVFAYKQKRKANSNELFCNMAMIMSVMCLMMTFYNASLRNEVAYMVFFVLALPLINSRSNIKELNRRLV